MIIHLFDFVKGDALLGKPPFARSWHRLATLVLAPQGDFLMGRKSPKTLQREIPLESPGFFVFYRFRPKSALGLVGRIGWLGASLESFYSADGLCSFHQGLKSGCSGLARPLSAGVRHK